MRKIIIIILIAACQISSQTQTIPMNDKGITRLRIGAGMAISSSASQLEDHLIKSGFGDKVNGKLDWLRDNGNDFYPQSETQPFVVELALERQFSDQVWMGISAGIDRSVSVKGYDRFGTTYSFWNGTYSIGQFVTMKHHSWFLSPQLSFNKEDSKVGLFGGPTIEFHTMSIQYENQRPIQNKQTKIGAVIGARANLGGNWEWFASYRFSSSLPYGRITNSFQNGNDSYTSTLHAGEINLNHFRTGFAYRFLW